jgi:type VI secretion system protein ImpH
MNDAGLPTFPIPENMQGERIRKFDFYQAVKLLEGLKFGRPGVGETHNPEDEAVRFKSRVGLDFPASDMHRLEVTEGNDPDRLWVNFLGLAGHFGPLPDAFTEWVMRESSYKNFAMGDFLDIFNHRLISLMVRNRRKHRLGLEAKPPQDLEFARWLLALLGLGFEAGRDRQAVSDRVFLDFTGLLLRQSRSLPGLEILLRDYFRVPVRGTQFIGHWERLEPDVCTKLGRFGNNRRLGRGAMLGKKVWDQQSIFGLQIGPVDPDTFHRFLPGGGLFEELQSLTQFYAGPSLTCRVSLSLNTTHLPGAALSSAPSKGAKLGWTSWLKADKVDKTPAIRLKL